MSGAAKLGVEVHVAVIEWSDDSIDPALFADIDEDRLLASIRAVIEAQVDSENAYDEWEHYVLEHIGYTPDYHEWYDRLHDIGDSPWVTIETKVI